MHITRVYIDGFKRHIDFTLEIDPTLNLIIGDNETGKSSILEAINLVLSPQFPRRNVERSLDPYAFNTERVRAYIEALRLGKNSPPPVIRIELCLGDDSGSSSLARLRGTNNSRNEDCPGLSLLIEPDSDFTEALKEYATDPSNPELIPVEFYKPRWTSFAGDNMTARTVPFKATMIDASSARGYRGPDKYVAQIVSSILSDEQQRQLSLAYKKLRHEFGQKAEVTAINEHLDEQGNLATTKSLTVQMDMSSRASWDSSVTAHLDDLPFDCTGKGEQCRVQMRLAIAGAASSRVLLIEEPENHLSHSNMNMLMDEITNLCANKHQVMLTTHSAFVLNKLGVDNLRLISRGGSSAAITGIQEDTKRYFMKLPGYDTLRLILSTKSFLVEGPSDELIVQKAYKDSHGKLPIEDGVDVISVGSLAFKRFLEIATLLNIDVCVVTDNDGDVEALKSKYRKYMTEGDNTVTFAFDDDVDSPTLEPQILKANSLAALNKILETSHGCEDDLLKYMARNKTDCALRIFETDEEFVAPAYIVNAIK